MYSRVLEQRALHVNVDKPQRNARITAVVMQRGKVAPVGPPERAMTMASKTPPQGRIASFATRVN